MCVVPPCSKAFLRCSLSCVFFPVRQFDPYVRVIPELKWDMKDFGLEHNSYVDDLIRDLRNFTAKIGELREFPSRSKKVAWETMLYLLMESIVEVRDTINYWPGLA